MSKKEMGSRTSRECLLTIAKELMDESLKSKIEVNLNYRIIPTIDEGGVFYVTFSEIVEVDQKEEYTEFSIVLYSYSSIAENEEKAKRIKDLISSEKSFREAYIEEKK